jgi:hypothetical protein
MISYLKHNQIDKEQWDNCIDNSFNRLVYAKSWYLDIVSPDWEALVNSDYSTVMPLPVKRKFFLSYLVQPLFTQQLGVFSVNVVTSDEVRQFLKYIPKKFVRQVFNLNFSNALPQTDYLTNRVNFELALGKNYTLIFDDYHENTKRNIKKARNNGLLIEISNDVNSFIKLYETFAKEKPNQFALNKLRKVLIYSIGHQKGEIVFAREISGDILSGAFFLKDLERVVYMASFTTTEGKEKSSMFLIMDEMIRKFAHLPFIFDFEGSMIPGVARFFAGFGAERKVYQQYRRSRWFVVHRRQTTDNR